MVRHIPLSVVATAIFFSFVAGILGAPTIAGAVDKKPILVVDMNRVFQESISGKAAAANFDQEKKKRSTIILKMEGDLKKLDEAMQKQGAVLSETAMKEKREQFEKKRLEYSRLAQDAQRELIKFQQAEFGKVLTKVDAIVKGFTEERSAQFVLDYDKRVVLYANESIDMTDELIEALDERA